MAAYLRALSTCLTCHPFTTAGNGEMVGDQSKATTQPLPPAIWGSPACSYLPPQMSAQEEFPASSSPSHLLTTPNTEGVNVTEPLSSSCLPELYHARDPVHQLQLMPLPSLHKTESTTPSKPRRGKRRVLSVEDRAKMRAYAGAHHEAINRILLARKPPTLASTNFAD